jgi:hypothetical protein
MTFRFIDELNIGINEMNLEALGFDTNPYSAILYQHYGAFSATPDKFGNQDQDVARLQFIEFVSLAIERNVSLAMTPEYSCPWSVIDAILLNEDLQPRNRKLFAFGCESITAAELRNLQENRSRDDIVIFFDNQALENNGNFLDPFCYLFRNSGKLFLIVQFKTNHMGVWTTSIERDNYKRGEEIYILRNNTASVYLFALICSEAMNFAVNEQFLSAVDHRWIQNAYIILNPQLNPKPNNQAFIDFKERILRTYDQKDLICLNWRYGTTANGRPFIKFGRSSFHLKTHQIPFASDNTFVANHRKGLYYLNNKTDLHSLYMCPYNPLYILRCQKPLTGGVPPVQLRKTEPQIQHVFEWDGHHFLELMEVHDHFIEYLDSHALPSAFLRRDDINCVDKERLFILSNGYLKASEHDAWFFINKLYSYSLDHSWTINRMTFLEDTNGDEFRIRCITGVCYLNEVLLRNEEYWPPILNQFKGHQISEIQFEDQPNPLKYVQNFIADNGKATVVYLDYGRKKHATKVMREIKNVFQQDARNIVVIWYKNSLTTNNFGFLTNEADNGISDVPDENSNSITRDE